MKTRRQIIKTAGAAFAALALIASAAVAGPGPQQVLRPVKNLRALSALQPGSHVSYDCPHCGTVHLTSVGKDKSHAGGFTCPTCHMKFEFRDVGGGKAKAGFITCVDTKTGKAMSAKVCAGH